LLIKIIKFDIDEYVIELFECKNKHDINHIFLDQFDTTQNINISKIICQSCGRYNKGNDIIIYFIDVIVAKRIYVQYALQIMIKIIVL
jgi:hypothetical protein